MAVLSVRRTLDTSEVPHSIDVLANPSKLGLISHWMGTL